MIIGNFSYDRKADTYTGDVTTLTFQRSYVQLRPVKNTGGKEPNYRILAETPLGNVEFGAAWKRVSEKGQAFLSVQIDDPTFSSALNAAMFAAEDGKTATLVWSRRKGMAKSEAAQDGGAA